MQWRSWLPKAVDEGLTKAADHSQLCHAPQRAPHTLPSGSRLHTESGRAAGACARLSLGAGLVAQFVLVVLLLERMHETNVLPSYLCS